MQFEVGRSDVSLVSFDFTTSRLIFKASVDEGFSGIIREVGLYSASTNTVAGEYGSRVITSFDSATEEWVNPANGAAATFNTSNTRIGADSLRQNPAAGATATNSLAQLFLDFSGHSAADKFVFAFTSGNAFASNIRIRFMTDASNYYEFALGAQTAGFKVVEAAKSAAVVTGSPTWGNITELRVMTTSTAGGNAIVDFEGIRIDDIDTINPDYVMVARELLPAPFVKEDGKIQEVEFSLDVSV